MRRFEHSLWFVVLPLFANLLLAHAAFVYHPGEYRGNLTLCWVSVIIALAAAAAALGGYFVRDLGPKRALLSLVAQGATLIVIFAGIYRGYGLVHGTQVLAEPGAEASLYFSITTFTTAGFGDFTPPPGLRLIAAIQALVGYVFLAAAIGLGTSLIVDKK